MPGTADVYCLSVQGERVFFAEGVLVANSDAARYAMMWIWKKDLSPPPIIRPIREGSVADVLGHRDTLEAMVRQTMD